MSDTRKVITAAPKGYDSYGTTHRRLLPLNDDRGRQLREVEITSETYEQQVSRYASGLYTVTTREEISANPSGYKVTPHSICSTCGGSGQSVTRFPCASCDGNGWLSPEDEEEFIEHLFAGLRDHLRATEEDDHDPIEYGPCGNACSEACQWWDDCDLKDDRKAEEGE